jgi:hypothetical protein
MVPGGLALLEHEAEQAMNPTGNSGLWLAILAISILVGAWNISRLWTVRPAIDRLVAVLGSAAILAVVTGVSLVVGAFAEPIAPPPAVAFTLCLALVTVFLRSDAVRAARGLPRTYVRAAR